MSWNVEVIADSSGKWVGNGLRFATKGEADSYGARLMWNWLAVREVRSVESQDAVNYTFKDGNLSAVEEKQS